MMQLDEAQIASRSYFIWEMEGKPEGRALDHWLRAKATLEAEEASQVTAARPKRTRATAAKKSDGAAKTRRPKAAGAA